MTTNVVAYNGVMYIYGDGDDDDDDDDPCAMCDDDSHDGSTAMGCSETASSPSPAR